MKHLILWTSLVGVAIGLALFWEKVSVAKTLFDIDIAPIYVNVVFCLLGVYLFVTRFHALLVQIFKL